MEEREQVTYMQVRIARMLAERSGTSLAQAARELATCGGFAYIEDNFGLFHLQGDEAVLEDVIAYVEHSKAASHA